MSEGFDLYDRLAATESGRRILEGHEASLRERDGVAAQTFWQCKDGWIVGYTTSRVQGGPHDGKFLAQAFKPVGKGARTGKAGEHVQAYRRAFSTRKAAKARAVAMYEQHSPK